MSQEWDLIIIGSGAGGGTLCYTLAQSGLRILLIERGDYLPKEKPNWDPGAVFLKNRYHSHEPWLDKEGKSFTPGMNYYVGGNTKVYGAALLRLRERDFEELHHGEGVSPAWPLKYSDFQSYYLEAEKLYTVHGKRGEDPTEPKENEPYPFPEVSHEPYIDAIAKKFEAAKLKPFHLPMAIQLNEAKREDSKCIRCDTCDGFPCLVDAKSDAHICCVNPALATGNVTLLKNAKALQLILDEKGERVQAVEVERGGQKERYSAKVVVVSCGAINSAALLLRSKHSRFPEGVANSSGLVGRNYMFHNNSVLIAVSSEYNPTSFQKTLAINDFYFGAQDSEYPLGHIQLLGKVKKEMLQVDAPKFAPGVALEYLADHCVGWWLTSEDLPDFNNRVRVNEQGQIVLEYTPNNLKAHEGLLNKFKELLKHLGPHTHLFPNTLYLSQQIPIGGCAHQAGTIRFGVDPKTSVLDLNCKAHDLANLYVVDSSFFPSIGAVNPTLTIIANALRVGKHLKKELSVV